MTRDSIATRCHSEPPRRRGIWAVVLVWSCAAPGRPAPSLTLGMTPGSHPRERRGDGLEDGEAVGVAEERLGAALRMGHHAEDVALAVADAGDVAGGAVRIRLARDPSFDVAVSEDDLPIALELVEGRVIGVVVPLAVRDRRAQDVAFGETRRERRVCFFGAQADVAADEAQMLVAHQSPRKQTDFG